MLNSCVYFNELLSFVQDELDEDYGYEDLGILIYEPSFHVSWLFCKCNLHDELYGTSFDFPLPI